MTIFKLLLAITLAASVAAAQNKLSGTHQCQQPSEIHSIEVGDHPGHAYAVSKLTCTWTKPLEIAGLKSKDETVAISTELDRNKGRDHLSGVCSMDNADKYYAHGQGTSTMKDQKFESSEGSWNFTGGTGKLKGIKGKGTYKCTPEADHLKCDVEGEYTLPSK
jgi:hypothetical protein